MRRLGALLLLVACQGPPPAPAPREEPTPPAAPAPKPDPTASPVLPAAQRPLPAADDFVPAKLPNGTATLLLPYQDDFTGMADLAFGVLAGADQGKQGLADLCAEVLLAGGDGNSSRPPLRQAIADLGGSIEVEVGPRSTWFGIRVPKAQWTAALDALGQALARPVASRAQIERVRSTCLPERLRAIWQDPTRACASRLLLGDLGTGPHIASLYDRDPSEVVLFRNRTYRPEISVLLLRVPAPAQTAVATAVRSLQDWLPGPTTPDPDAGPHQRSLPDGAFGCPTVLGPLTATLVLPQPEPTSPLAAELLVLQNCITLDGIGGRLERLLQEAGLRLECRSRFVQCGETSALAITAQVAPRDLQRFWQVAQAARQSLAALPPTDSELELAIGAAQLSAQRPALSPWRGMRDRALRAMRGQPADAVLTRLQALRPTDAAARPAWLQPAIKAFVALPTCFLVLGGELPADATWVRRFELMPPASLAQLAGNQQAPATLAQPHLDLACEVAGGKSTLAAVVGFGAESTTVANRGPELHEQLSWQRDGTLRSTRRLLDSTIETDLRPGRWVESVGGSEAQLGPAEASARLRQCERHPLALLAAIARGELRFRAVASRTVGGREWLVFEAVTDRFERLRIHLDAESHVLRQVESWETAPGGAPVYVVEEWSDPTTTAGLRLPMRCTTVVDDGAVRRVTTFRSCTPHFLRAP